MNATETSSALGVLSTSLAEAVERAARCIVAIDADSRYDASGILWRPGLIVTANHSVSDDDEISVALPDGMRVTGSVTGRDPTTDVALIGIAEQADQRAAAFATDETLRVGALVLALSRDSESGVSASLGVVSTLGEAWRTWRGGHIERFIRADVSMYPGYSGGPLVDGAGRIIGMNTSGLSRRLGVTIPVATIDRVVNALAAGGRIVRGYLGVGMQPVRLPHALQQSLNIAGHGGVIVIAVEPGGPAERSGILIGDVFITAGDTRIEDVDDMRAVLGPDSVGKSIPAQVVRGGQLTTLMLTIGERPSRED